MAQENKIAIIGLGYIGLPLAVAFAEKYAVVGFDINPQRIHELSAAKDHTLEVEEALLRKVLLRHNPVTTEEIGFFCTADAAELKGCNYYIITVPTPTDRHNSPDLTYLYKASETVGKVLGKNDIVIYESTVYPGATEDECVPVLEKISGLQYNKDFFVGYSPERINPGDKEHTVTKIKKITSGSTPATAQKVDDLYKSIITAGTHLAPSIKVAEAAKVIENSQRDINIAFVNELAKIFNRIGIDTADVLEAAGTKWNFLKFRPGLVGGHCIGVDPYYLAQKAQEIAYYPEIILAGRRLNDAMGGYVAGEVIKLMVKKGVVVNKAKILVLGFTFKENCPDVRNTKVIDVVHALKDYDTDITVFDPWACPAEVLHEYSISSTQQLGDVTGQYDAVILAVAHKAFEHLDVKGMCKPHAVIYDVKGVLPREIVDGRL